jgi:pyridoxine kinase
LNILSIQSWVAYGHVGNAAALFPLQRLGAEVWAVNTVQFSNHPGHGDWTGRVSSGAEIADVIAGIERRGVFASCDAVLSGYMGDASVADAILDAVARVRAANGAALYCCDPVIGDGGRVYVQAGIPELLAASCVPEADLLTPNQFELERLTGQPCATKGDIRRALGDLRRRMRPEGPRAVLLTSARTDETPPDALDVVAADEYGLSTLRVPLLPVAASGAGDATAALFLYHFLRTGRAAASMAAAAASIHGLLRRTAASGSRELLLTAAQDELVTPSCRFAMTIY